MINRREKFLVHWKYLIKHLLRKSYSLTKWLNIRIGTIESFFKVFENYVSLKEKGFLKGELSLHLDWCDLCWHLRQVSCSFVIGLHLGLTLKVKWISIVLHHFKFTCWLFAACKSQFWCYLILFLNMSAQLWSEFIPTCRPI